MADKSLSDLEDFISKAEQAQELVTALQSADSTVVKQTQDKIDYILSNDWEEQEEGYRTSDGFSKSCINKIENPPPAPPGDMLGGFPADMPADQAGFMRAVEDDANRRAENRRRKEEKSAVRKEKGNEAFKRGDYTAAIEQYDIAINITGWNVSLYTNKAQSYIKLKEYDNAIEACDKALYIEDNFTKAYVQKCNALIAKCCYTEAVACLELCQENCKGSSSVVKKYLDKANTLVAIETDNNAILQAVSSDNRKEFEHLLSKLGSDKVVEVTISAELMLKSLENSATNRRLFRALGGLTTVTQQLPLYTDHTLHVLLFSLLKLLLTRDMLTLYTWLYLDPAHSLVAHVDQQQFRFLLLLLLQKLVFCEDDKVASLFLDYWTNKTLTKTFVECLEDETMRGMSVLVLGRVIRHNNFLLRFKDDMIGMLKCVSTHIPHIVTENLTEQKTWIAGLSGLSMTTVARRLLDKTFWENFLPLLDSLSPHKPVLDDLLVSAQNFAVDSVALSEHGKDISSKLVEMCGEECRRAPLLLNRVLEKCPNTLLAEDKGQFSSLLKVIKGRTELDEDLSIAVKLLTRTTAVSEQARKWVLKYNILECLVEMLESNVVTSTTTKCATAILSNAALCCAHCYQDVSVCKKREVSDVDVFLKHAKSDKGLAIQQNAAIALARLATNNPKMLERLRELRGLEVLHSRFTNP